MHKTAADSADDDVDEGRASDRARGIRGVDFDRGKTGRPTFISLRAALLDEIDANGSAHFVTNPFGQPYTAVVDDARMRAHATAAGP